MEELDPEVVDGRLAIIEEEEAFLVVRADDPDDWLVRFEKRPDFPAHEWAENMVRVYNRRLAIGPPDLPRLPARDRAATIPIRSDGIQESRSVKMLARNSGDGTRRRVTHIDAFRFRESLEVHTDAGLVGLGESYFGAKLVEAYGDEVAHHCLLSKYILHIGEHAKDLNGYLNYSSSGTQTRDDSAIDIALRDPFDKITDQPVYRLLVAPCRQKIRSYNSCAGYRYARTHPRVTVGDGETPMPRRGAMNVALVGGRSHPGDHTRGNYLPIHRRASQFGGRDGAPHADEDRQPRILPGG
jgi:hypothetical protein